MYVKFLRVLLTNLHGRPGLHSGSGIQLRKGGTSSFCCISETNTSLSGLEETK